MQASNRPPVSKKAWAKPAIQSFDDLTLFRSGPHPAGQPENATYYMTS